MTPSDDAPSRRQAILDAAERCFVRAGFHRTTMQDVAAEAGMSPGNLYRYFPSKDVMVAGLTERDRAELRRKFSTLPDSGDFLADFGAFGRAYFENEPREKSILCLEIWAEATRNPTVAAHNAEFGREVRERLAGLFAGAKARGAIPVSVDAEAAASVVLALSHGLFVARALGRYVDYPRDVANVFTVIKALLAGKVPFDDRAPEGPTA